MAAAAASTTSSISLRHCCAKQQAKMAEALCCKAAGNLAYGGSSSLHLQHQPARLQVVQNSAKAYSVCNCCLCKVTAAAQIVPGQWQQQQLPLPPASACKIGV
jgi:hypothetical protein